MPLSLVRRVVNSIMLKMWPNRIASRLLFFYEVNSIKFTGKE